MKIKIWGENYTGAHTRGISDPCDQRQVIMELTGTSQNLADYVLDNFCYGQDPDTDTAAIVANFYEFEWFSGAGGIFKMQGDFEIDATTGDDAFGGMDEDGEEVPFDQLKFIDLGAFDVDALPKDQYYDHVNRLIDVLKDQGKLPHRGEMDGTAP